MKRNVMIAVFLVACVLTYLLFFSPLKPQALSIGYLIGAQGLSAEFNSLQIANTWLSANEKPASFTLKDRTLSANTASNWFFGYELNFDPDENYDGFPNLMCSQQPILVDTQVEPKYYSWQVDKGTVTLSNGTKAQKFYQFEMWRYKCSWSINIWLSGSEEEAWDRAWHYGIGWEPDYGGTSVWIKIIPQNFVYFSDNPDELYFAPAYIGVESYTIASFDRDQKKIENDPDMLSCIDLSPKNRGETFGIYYQRGGGEINLENKLFSYNGLELDPKVFRNEYWIHIDLTEFKPWNNVDFWNKAHSWKFPSINLQFTVYVYVVGKWTVYIAEGEVPNLSPHDPLVKYAYGLFDWLSEWLSNPINQLWVFFIILVLVIVSVTNPVKKRANFNYFKIAY